MNILSRRDEDVSKYAKVNYTREQMEEYSLALKENVDILRYLDSNFDDKQLKEIRLGFNSLQMKEIRLGLLNKVKVSKYAKKEINWKEMRELRFDLMEEKQLSNFALIKRKLKKKNVNQKEKDKCEEAIKLCELEEQEIREEYEAGKFLFIAKTNMLKDLENGLDVSWYLNSEFNFSQFVAISRGLYTGIDVSKYALPEISIEKMNAYKYILNVERRRGYPANFNFNYEQMDEIEKGLEKGLDVSIYDKEEFNGDQMEQIRKGLEKNLNVSKYAKPEYNWKIMRQMRRKLKKDARKNI